jgi:hypothetical protein
MTTVVTEGPHAGNFILSEAAGQRSRENVTLLSGEVIFAGTVLAKVSTKYVPYHAAAGNGSGSDTALAVSINNVDATGGDVEIAVIARDAEVNGYQLRYENTSPDADPDAVAVQLKAVGIIVRWGSDDHTAVSES